MKFNFALLKAFKFTNSFYQRMSSVFVTESSDSQALTSTRTSKHKIAICQLTCNEDKNQNFNTCKDLITKAKDQGAEVFGFLFNLN